MRLTTLLTICALFGLLLLISCSNQPSSPAASSTSTPVSSPATQSAAQPTQPVRPVPPPPPPPPSNADQAVTLVKKSWEGIATQCGDSYYVALTSSGHITAITRLRDVNFTVPIVNPVTDVQRMNGLEWSGVVDIHWRMQRTFWYAYGRPSWADWENGKGASNVISKSKGQWNVSSWFQPIGEGYGVNLKIKCSDVPNG